MEILIIGGGNGGLAYGAKLIERGFKVNLYDKYEEVIYPIIRNNNEILLIENEKYIRCKFNHVSTNLTEVIQKVDIIFVVTPAFAHRPIAKDLINIISEDQIIVLHPGRTGGALEVKNILHLNGKHNIVAETETLLFACRKLDDITIKIFETKKSVDISVLPNELTHQITNNLNQLLPYFQPCENVFETSINNIGAIFHPIPFIFNLTRIECNQPFKYYHEGITPKIANILEEADKERVNIGKSYGANVKSVVKWMKEKYHVDAINIYESIQNNKKYNNILSPMDINARYVLEDVPTGLVPLSYLAKEAGVNTPVIDSVIQLANTLYERNFYETGRTLDKMGLNNYHILNGTDLL